MKILNLTKTLSSKKFCSTKKFIEDFQSSFEKSEDWKSIYNDPLLTSLKLENQSDLDLRSLQEVLSDPFQDLMSRKSKKLRPLLIQVAADLLHVQNDYLIVQSASYIECLHANLLMLDDIMDKSDIRRGDLAVHLKFGVDVTLASSGFVHHKTIRQFVNNLGPIEPSKKLRVYELIFEYMELIYIGLAWDVAWHGNKNIDRIPTLQNYFLMCELKTAKLMNLAIDIFKVVQELDEAKVASVLRAFEFFGIGFQINDDLINLFSQEYSVLKGMDDDLVEGKMSYPILHFCQENKNELPKIAKLFELLNSENKNRKTFDLIKSFIKTDKCLADGISVCESFMQKCFLEVEQNFGENIEAVSRLQSLAKFVVKNESLKSKTN